MLMEMHTTAACKLVIAHSTASEFLTLLVFGTNVSDAARNANVMTKLLLEAPLSWRTVVPYM